MANNHSDYTIIRVTPTLTASEAYSVGDVLFTATEIPNAVRGEGGCSKVLGGFILDQDRDTFEVDLLFTELSTAIGTIHDTANISDGDMEAIGYCGSLKYDSSQGVSGTTLDTVKIGKLQSLFGGTDGEHFDNSMLIQATAGSTSVYVSGVLAAGTPTFAAVDDVDIILHIQYR